MVFWKLNQDQVNDLNSPISPKEIEAVINGLPTTKSQDKMGLVQSSITFKGDLIDISTNYSKK